MKYKALKGLLLLSALICSSCAKKKEASENQVTSDKSDSLATARIVNAESELERSVRANDTVALRRVIFENPDLNLNGQLPEGDTFLTYAVKKKFHLIRNILLEKGAHPDIVSQDADFSGMTPLMIAAHLGDTGSIRALLEAKASLDGQDWLGDTALHKAIKSRSVTAAQALIYAGSDLKIENDKQETPLKLAERLQVKEIAEYLRGLNVLEQGTMFVPVFRKILRDADIVNYRRIVKLHPHLILEIENINPLVEVIESPNDLRGFEIAQSLLSLKISPDGPIVAETTPINRAVELKKRDFTELLIRFNVNLNNVDNEGRPPLYFAITNNDEQMVDLLIQNGAKEKLPGFRSCRLANQVKKRLTTPEERYDNQRIQSRLGCFWTR